MVYIMLSANYRCTINKTQDNQLVGDMCLLLMGSRFLQAKPLHRPTPILKGVPHRVWRLGERTPGALFPPLQITSELKFARFWKVSRVLTFT